MARLHSIPRLKPRRTHRIRHQQAPRLMICAVGDEVGSLDLCKDSRHPIMCIRTANSRLGCVGRAAIAVEQSSVNSFLARWRSPWEHLPGVQMTTGIGWQREMSANSAARPRLRFDVGGACTSLIVSAGRELLTIGLMYVHALPTTCTPFSALSTPSRSRPSHRTRFAVVPRLCSIQESSVIGRSDLESSPQAP